MRVESWLWLITAAGVGVTTLAACWPVNYVDDCDENPNLPCYWAAAAGTGGSDGGTPAACVPSENAEPVGDACGVFVAKGGDDSNEGTRESPVATLTKAVELAKKESGRVYACAETFNEALVLDSGIEMYGGLDCAKGWAYAGATSKTTLTAEADAIPLVLESSATGARVEDFAIHAADAVMEGGSSVAVLADGATAELVRCELVSGDGAKGADGEDGDPTEASAKAGAAGSAGKKACSDLDGTPGPDGTLLGGAQVTNDCGSDEISIGGSGGDGNVTNGGGGDVGQTGTKGQAGLGEPTMGMWDCDVGGGKIGSSGEAGAHGTGAMGFGSISASGYVGVSGGAGSTGKAGQGGGGGGGAKGGKICAGGVAGSGASGGSGGAGGCGGLPGQGGGAGGASIALVSLSASVTLTDCTLTAGKGGDGGAGGDAQPGGPGGVAGLGGQSVGVSNPGCSGGQGGKGGNGGPGGGGLGGPSIGIAFQGSAPEKNGETKITPTSPGLGGPGGSVNVAMNAGADGVAAELQELP